MKRARVPGSGGRGARPRRARPQALGELLPGMLEDLGLGSTSRALRIAERWEQAVGGEIARRCRPVALRGEVLEVAVDSSVWCQQLQLRTPELLAALRGVLGDDAPAELWLRVGSVVPGGRGAVG